MPNSLSISQALSQTGNFDAAYALSHNLLQAQIDRAASLAYCALAALKQSGPRSVDLVAEAESAARALDGADRLDALTLLSIVLVEAKHSRGAILAHEVWHSAQTAGLDRSPRIKVTAALLLAVAGNDSAREMIYEIKKVLAEGGGIGLAVYIVTRELVEFEQLFDNRVSMYDCAKTLEVALGYLEGMANTCYSSRTPPGAPESMITAMLDESVVRAIANVAFGTAQRLLESNSSHDQGVAGSVITALNNILYILDYCPSESILEQELLLLRRYPMRA